MKLARLRKPDGSIAVGVLDGDLLQLTSVDNPLQVLSQAELEFSGEEVSWGDLYTGVLTDYELLPPIDAPEVWAFGFTYKRGPQFSHSPMIPKGEAYTHAIESSRPEIFFKTTGYRVVGHNQSVGIRGDSTYGAVEAELCMILDDQAQPVLFTAGNDVSAWDIESQNPLWLAQSKTFEACCALGPIAVTRDHIPENARVQCQVLRGNKTLFEDSVALSDLHWSYEELASFARTYTPLPPGTVLMTGTAVIRPGTEGLIQDDVVEVSIDGIGGLRNSARLLVSGVQSSRFEFA